MATAPVDLGELHEDDHVLVQYRGGNGGDEIEQGARVVLVESYGIAVRWDNDGSTSFVALAELVEVTPFDDASPAAETVDADEVEIPRVSPTEFVLFWLDRAAESLASTIEDEPPAAVELPLDGELPVEAMIGAVMAMVYLCQHGKISVEDIAELIVGITPDLDIQTEDDGTTPEAIADDVAETGDETGDLGGTPPMSDEGSIRLAIDAAQSLHWGSDRALDDFRKQGGHVTNDLWWRLWNTPDEDDAEATADAPDAPNGGAETETT